MLKTLCLCFAAIAASGAEDPWDKVRDLASGSELRIYRAGVRRPVTATLDRVSGDALIVARKDAQTAIPKDRVERVDWRPADSARRVTPEARRVVGSRESATTGRNPDTTLPPRSTSGGIRIRGPRDFQTVYLRSAASSSKD